MRTMNRSDRKLPGLALSVCAAMSLLATLADAEDLSTLEQKALVAAVDRVAPSVVRIETIGGLERVDRVLFGTGPTTGLVVDSSGYILSSAFNFVNRPASILVRLPDGTRKPAKLVARDHNCKLALLKIEPDHPLPVPEVAPQGEMRVGQWCVAVGRTFEESRPNMAVGILSAVGRVWGKALQTDAPVSPNNYGGPLVDIRGRVMGILVPLSPQSADEIAGVEWYDSGIGFAVPLEGIEQVLPKLRKGEDLYTGVAGVFMQSKNLYTGNTVIGSCRPNSPAAKAGFKGGDCIVEIGGHKIARAAEVKQEISRHYAGDKLHFVVMRGDKRIEADLELISRLEPFQHGFLGILPLRDGEDAGATVRYVYPGSPAAEAKIEPGDVIESVAGDDVMDPDELRSGVSAFEPGMAMELEVRHKDKTRKLTVKMAELPVDLPPAALPGAFENRVRREAEAEDRTDRLCPARLQQQGLGLCAPALQPVCAARCGRVAARVGRAGRGGPLGPMEAALRGSRPDLPRPPTRRGKWLADGRGWLCREAGCASEGALHRGLDTGRRLRSRYGGLAGLALGLPQPRPDSRRRGDRRRFDASAAGD